MNMPAAEATDTWIDRLIAPYDRLGRSAMAVLTTAGVVLGVAASHFGIRFDGFLDLHRTPDGASVPLSSALADQFVALPLSAAVAWLVLRAFGTHPRLGLLVLMIGVMRLPLVLATPAVLAAPDPAMLAQGSVESMPSLIGVGLVTVLCFTWTVTLLVTGVRFVSTLRGKRLAGAVISIVLSAEIASKLALALLS